MAKNWNPSKKQLSAYEELVKRYQKVRRKIIKAHRNFSEFTVSGRLPSLVVPERHRKMSVNQIRLSGRRLFNLKIKQLKKVVAGGLDDFYKKFKDSYLELYRRYIIEDDPEYNPFGGEKGFLYSEDQIKLKNIDDPKMAQFMIDYNNLVRMNRYLFAFLIKSGKLPEFKQIYREFKGLTFEESFGEDVTKAIKQSRHFDLSFAKKVAEGLNISHKDIEKHIKLTQIDFYRADKRAGIDSPKMKWK